MKHKFLLVSFITAILAVACSVEEPYSHFEGLDVSNDYLTIAAEDGAYATITVKGVADWTAETSADWVSLSPASGAAGQEVSFKITASASTKARKCEVNIVMDGRKKIILVNQEAPAGVIVPSSTCKEVEDGPDKTYRVTGTVTKIANTHYGNLYINDGTVEGDGVYVYGVLDKKGGANASSNKYDNLNDPTYANSWDIAVGDLVTIEGPKEVYQGTVELKNVTVIEIVKSLIKVENVVVGEDTTNVVPIEGGSFKADLSCKGNGVKVNVPADAISWLSVVGVSTSDGKTEVTFLAQPNTGGDRETTVEFETSDGSKSYKAEQAIQQKGSILEVTAAEFNAAEDGNTIYRVSGIVTNIAQDSDKYGTNLYFKDATGEIYLYGSVDESGAVEQLVAKRGVKVGDIITLVGKKSSHNGTPQMKNGTLVDVKPVAKMNATLAAELADDNKANPQNYIMITGVVTKPSAEGNKFDLDTYGNFDIVDDSGSIYVYGVSTGWKGVTKQFGTLGVKEGDNITIVAYKTSYNGVAQLVGMYVSHEEMPADGALTLKDNVLPTQYGEESVIKVGLKEFYINQVGNFGNGIQFKRQEGYIANKTSLGKIKKVTLVPSKTKTWYPDNVKFYAGSSEKPSTEVAATTSDCLEYDLSSLDCSFFKIADLSDFAFYLESITVEYE